MSEPAWASSSQQGLENGSYGYAEAGASSAGMKSRHSMPQQAETSPRIAFVSSFPSNFAHSGEAGSSHLPNAEVYKNDEQAEATSSSDSEREDRTSRRSSLMMTLTRSRSGSASKSKRQSWDRKGKAVDRGEQDLYFAKEERSESPEEDTELAHKSKTVSPERLSWQTTRTSSSQQQTEHHPARRKRSGSPNTPTASNIHGSAISNGNRRSHRAYTFHALSTIGSQSTGKTKASDSTDSDSDDGSRLQDDNTERKHRSYHLPRAASEFIVSGTTPSISAARRASMHRQHRSGSSSPTLSMKGRATSYTIGQQPPSSGYSRTSSSSAISPLRSPPSSRPSHPSGNKRYPSDSLPRIKASTSTQIQSPALKARRSSQYLQRHRSQSFRNASKPILTSGAGASSFPPESAPPGRSFSSSTYPRKRTISTASHRPSILKFANSDSDDDDVRPPSPGQEKVVRLNEAPTSIRNDSQEQKVMFPAVHIDVLPSKRTSVALKPIPTSISGLLGSNTSAQGVGTPDAGPSLQELLSQVDVKGALALVREVQNNSANLAAPLAPAGQAKRASLQLQQSPSAQKARSVSRTRPTSLENSRETNSILSSQPSASSFRGSSAAGTHVPLLGEDRIMANEIHLSYQRQNGVKETDFAQNLDVNAAVAASSDKRKRKLSIAAFKGISNSNRQKKMERLREKEEYVQSEPLEHPSEYLQKLTPAMLTYVAHVKSELEMRYLPVYTALTAGEKVPNPAEIARWRYRREEFSRRSRAQHRTDMLRSSSWQSQPHLAEHTDPLNQSLYQSLRANGSRHPVWEVYPSDYVSFANSGGSVMDHAGPLESSPDGLQNGYMPSPDGSSRLKRNLHKPSYHRSLSSDVSIPNLASIHEGFDSPSGPLNEESRRASIGGQLGTSAYSTGGGRYSFSSGRAPFSPARSYRSTRSASLTHEDAVALARSPVHNGTSQLSRSATNLPATAHTRYQNAMQAGPEQLHQTDNPAASLPKAQSSTRLKDRIRQLTARDMQDNYPYTDRKAADTITSPVMNSDSEMYSTRPSVQLALLEGGKGLSRHSSKSSSIANLSKMLAVRKGGTRSGNETDGYKSTDNEEGTESGRGTRAPKWRSILPTPVPSGSRAASPFDETVVEEANGAEAGGTSTDVFDTEAKSRPEVIEASEADMKDAMSLLDDVRTSLAKATAMAPRVPPKLRIYQNEFYAHDRQRREKGQLSNIELPKFPTAPSRLESMQDAKSDPVQDDATSSPADGDRTSRPSRLLNGEANAEATPDGRRVPHLEKVEAELDHVKTELQAAASRVAEIRMQQDHLCNDIQMIAKQADQTQELIDNEIFHQLRLVEDHFIRLRYRLSESSGLVDASWAALSYVLRIFFWFSWIGVTLLRLIKAVIMLPITVVVKILRLVV